MTVQLPEYHSRFPLPCSAFCVQEGVHRYKDKFLKFLLPSDNELLVQSMFADTKRQYDRIINEYHTLVMQ